MHRLPLLALFMTCILVVPSARSDEPDPSTPASADPAAEPDGGAEVATRGLFDKRKKPKGSPGKLPKSDYLIDVAPTAAARPTAAKPVSIAPRPQAPPAAAPAPSSRPPARLTIGAQRRPGTAPAPSGAPPRPSRPAPSGNVDNTPPNASAPASGRPLPRKIGRYNVRKRLGAGGYAEAFLVADPKRPRDLQVLKRSRGIARTPGGPTNSGPEFYYNELNHRRRNAALGENRPIDGQAEVPPKAKGFISRGQLLRGLARHEVEMQNAAAATGHPAFVKAAVVGSNKQDVRMPYAGAALSRVTPRLKRLGDAEKKAAVGDIFDQTLGAAAALNRAGLVHRDLGPDNLTVDAQGRVKVIDFGLAKRARDPDVELTLNKGVGFAGYGQQPWSAPELGRAGAGRDPTVVSTHKADVFALGHTLRKVKNDADIQSPELDALLDDMQKPTPSDRPSAQQALDRLRAFGWGEAQGVPER